MTVAGVSLDSFTSSEDIDHYYVKKVYEHKEYFHRSLECFTEEDSNFRPSEELLSVAGQILHVALSIEYFLSGMFGYYEGFGPLSRRHLGFLDMNWIELADEKNLYMVLDPVDWPQAFEASTSIAKALKLFDEAMDTAAQFLDARSVKDIEAAQLPENPMFDPTFRYPDIIELMNDHTAHHRGSLVVYAHLLGKEPRIPYFDMSAVVAYAQQFQDEELVEQAAV